MLCERCKCEIKVKGVLQEYLDPLSRQERAVFMVLYANAGRVVEYEEIKREAWPESDPQGVTLDLVRSHIRNIRHKVSVKITTRKGVGYRLWFDEGNPPSPLTDKEARALRLLQSRQGEVVGYNEFKKAAWDKPYWCVSTSRVYSLIARLRRKRRLVIQTHIGEGYRLLHEPNRSGNP